MANLFQPNYNKWGLPGGPYLAGEALSAGALVKVHTDGTIKNALGDAAADCAIGYVIQDYVSGAPVQVWVQGLLQGAGSGLTIGARVFLSPTVAGGITQTLPATAGKFIQPVGTAINATDVYFNVNSFSVLQVQAAGNSTAALG